jgi:hypothetical protein
MNYWQIFRSSSRIDSGVVPESPSPSRSIFKNVAKASLVGLAVLISALSFGQQGTWTRISSNCPEMPETSLLLMDGSIFVKSFDGDFSHCFKLTPNGNSYVGGKWSQIASLPTGLIYGPTGVFSDGKVFVAGGEYVGTSNDDDTAQVYDPVANTWKVAPDGLYGDIEDTAAAPLPDGSHYLVSYIFGNQTQIFDENANTWTASAPMLTPGGQTWEGGDEQGFQGLPDGSILGVFFWGQRYLPTLNEWVLTPPLPNTLVDSGFEIGPEVMLYNGKVFITGACVGAGQTAVYTPPSSLLSTDDSWAAGPVIPNNYGCPDCPSCVESNGKVLFISTPVDYAEPYFNEYDPNTNTIQQINGPPTVIEPYSYEFFMLELPTGQTWVSGFGENGNEVWLYTPVSGPQSSWRANLTGLTLGSDGVTYTLTGQQLNGLTNGAAYGDEGEMYTNYPVVSLKNTTTGVNYFARAFNPTNLLLATGNVPVQTHFVLPSTIPAGNYQLTTSASGVGSANFLTIGFGILMPPQTTETATPGGTVSYALPATDYYTPARTIRGKVSHGPSWLTWDGVTLTASPPAGTLIGDYPAELYAYDSGTPQATSQVAIMVRVAAVALTSAKFSSSVVAANSTAHLVVTLSQPAPAGGTVISLASKSAYLTSPATYTIPEGNTTYSIPISSGNPPVVTLATVSVSYGTLAIPASIRIFPGGSIFPGGG